MANSVRIISFFAIVLCVIFLPCYAIQYMPNRPQNRPYWWLQNTPWKKIEPENLGLPAIVRPARQDPCACPEDNLDCFDLREKCRPQQYEAEQSNNEVDSEVDDLMTEETTPTTTSTTTTSTTSSTFTTTTSKPKKTGSVFSAAELDEPDEPEEDESENMYCGIDARDKIFDLKTQDQPSTSTDFAEYPWVLYVYHKEDNVVTSLCAATLLESNIAITAAHCIKQYRNKHLGLNVRAGEWDLESEFGADEGIEHQDRKVKNIIVHPNFTESRMLNDIAILHLDQPFLRKNNIRNICLPTREDLYAKTCIAAGWGNTGSLINPMEQRYMRQSLLTKIDRKDCQNEFRHSGKGPRFRLRSTQLCARNTEGGGTCVGGCGGGLYCQISEEPYRFVLVGLGSWGKCSDKEIGVFTNVFKFKEWIMDRMDDIKEMQSR